MSDSTCFSRAYFWNLTPFFGMISSTVMIFTVLLCADSNAPSTASMQKAIVRRFAPWEDSLHADVYRRRFSHADDYFCRCKSDPHEWRRIVYDDGVHMASLYMSREVQTHSSRSTTCHRLSNLCTLPAASCSTRGSRAQRLPRALRYLCLILCPMLERERSCGSKISQNIWRS